MKTEAEAKKFIYDEAGKLVEQIHDLLNEANPSTLIALMALLAVTISKLELMIEQLPPGPRAAKTLIYVKPLYDVMLLLKSDGVSALCKS